MVLTKDIMSKIQIKHFQFLTVSLVGRPINKEEFCTVPIPEESTFSHFSQISFWSTFSVFLRSKNVLLHLLRYHFEI